MPRYDDPSVFYDDPAVFYDAAPLSPRRNNMAKVITGSARMKLPQLQAAVTNVITKMTGNATYMTPNPSLMDLQTLLTNSQTKNAAYVAAKTAADQALVERDVAKKALADAYELEAAYVQNQSAGDEVKILSAGYEVRATAAPIGPVGQVLNVAVTEGDGEGSVDVQHDPVNGGNSYETAVYIGNEPSTGTYTTASQQTASKTTLTGLTSGTRIWVKVRAIGAQGPGPWSDPATKIVP
jgi:hypothetical protein